MSTLGALKARIARDLTRDDLTTDIAAVIVEAIDEAAATRFWFNEVRELTFNTVAGQSVYGGAALADIPRLTVIDEMWIIRNGQRERLKQTDPQTIDKLLEGTATTGEPYLFARQADSIRLWRVPDQIYPVYIDGISKLAPLGNDSASNAWTVEGEYLIRTLAKARLCEGPVEDFERADIFFARYEQIRRDLMRQTTGRHATGTMALCGV